MGVIYLVRHGQADPNAYGVYGSDEPPVNGPGGLTDAGQLQARLTGTLLSGLTDTITAALSGDLPRQSQTLAGVLAQVPGAPTPEVDPDWNEYALPALVGSTSAEEYRDGRSYQQRLDAGLADWISGTGEHGTGETFTDFAKRVRAAAERATALAGSGQTVLVVSSAGTITQWLAQLWEIPPSAWPALSRTMVNASVSKLIVGRSGVSVVSFNEHAHLADREGGLATFR
ncbi:histidine phosphatase family protein [Gordonia sp. Z-3]|uniref:Histidine phosphatase family protein n=1 Tax=Gordonia aquimaris TaxID=2984863 RepID=A0A9X3D4W4_9ACTN|nr:MULTISPECIES: histidine phosphatase family protein [Gordonia]MAU81355.1 histidine phosphatase family protein [Gordonia sp. (in: high G+C Gram-positive bacteria)]MCX2963667.1 histidine phosphatase family protein [Gordonia aquimaris]MED5802195.1 histidine phosphatase family protein [Gordonia sp. Z-3]